MFKEAAATDEVAGGPEIILVLNWFDELQRLVPTPDPAPRTASEAVPTP